MSLRIALLTAVSALAVMGGTSNAVAACPVDLVTKPCPPDSRYDAADHRGTYRVDGPSDWYVTVDDFNARMSIPSGAGELVPHDPVLDRPHYANGSAALASPAHRGADAKGRAGPRGSAWSGHRRRMAFGR